MTVRKYFIQGNDMNLRLMVLGLWLMSGFDIYAMEENMLAPYKGTPLQQAQRRVIARELYKAIDQRSYSEVERLLGEDPFVVRDSKNILFVLKAAEIVENFDSTFMLSKVLSAGGNPNEVDPVDGNTAAHIAARSLSLEALIALQVYKADLTKRNNAQESPSDMILKGKNIDRKRLLQVCNWFGRNGIAVRINQQNVHPVPPRREIPTELRAFLEGPCLDPLSLK